MGGTITSALLHSTQAHCRQLSTVEVLEWGEAHTSTRFAGLHEANQFREFRVPDEIDVPTAYEAVEAHFAERGLTCFRWSSTTDQPYEAMGRFLCEKGYRRRDVSAWVLAQWTEVRPADGVRILPARPMRQQYRQTFLDPAGPYPNDYQELSAEAGLERLDNAGYDAYVAIVDDRPVGRGALFQVGDIGRVIDLYVLSAYRRRGVGTALLAHVLTIAKRVMARTICLEIEADNLPTQRCVERMGFLRDPDAPGLVEFHHPNVILPEYDQR